jgi:hypothetical protein
MRRRNLRCRSPGYGALYEALTVGELGKSKIMSNQIAGSAQERAWTEASSPSKPPNRSPDALEKPFAPREALARQGMSLP